MTTVSVVTVTHDSTHVLPGFFAALGDQPEGCEVVVVDSGSRDQAATRALAQAVGARFVDAGSNVGYGSGSNLGAAQSSGAWLAFVNPDVEVAWGSLLRLVDVARRHDLACVGPQIVDGDARPVPSGHAFLRPPWARQAAAAPPSREVAACEVVSGCALVIERDAFVGLDGFDESFFLFAEEHDLLRRLAAAGGAVGVAREVTARTVGGASSDSVSSRWSAAERSVGHIRYIRKHHGLAVGVLDLGFRCLQACVRPELAPASASLRQILGAHPLRLSRHGVSRLAAGVVQGLRRPAPDRP